MKKFDKNDFVIDDVFKMIDKKIKKKSKKKTTDIVKNENSEEYYVITV